MQTGSPTTRRSSRVVAAVAVAAVALSLLAGPGRAETAAAPQPGTIAHLDANGTFGPTVPFSVDQESATSLAAIVNGDARQSRPVTMDFISVDEGVEIEIISQSGDTAAVRLVDGPNQGRVGYVPTAWVSSV